MELDVISIHMEADPMLEYDNNEQKHEGAQKILAIDPLWTPVNEVGAGT